MTPSDLDKALAALRDKVAGGPSMTPAVVRRIAADTSTNAMSMAPREGRRRTWRITLSSGIAACLLAAVGIAWLSHGDRTASAAEELQQAVEAGKAYKGWIHMTSETAGLKRPAGAPPLPKRVTYHTSTVDGSMVAVQEYAEGVEISGYFITRGETAAYSYKTNEIRIGSLHDETARTLRASAAPATLDELLALTKKQFGREPASIKETTEGDLKRFDIAMFASDAEAKQFRKEHDVDFLSDGVVVWINKDKLMTRMQLDDPSGKVTAEITYGGPDIRDIYDVGAPRTAKVVDVRMKNDLKSLMARVDGRALKGFGDYTGLLATYEQDAAGKVSPDFGYVTLFAVKGEKWLAMEYRLFSTRARPEVVLQEPPDAWPAPDVARLLPALLAGKPTSYKIMDGDHGWAGWYNTGPDPYPDARLIAAKERTVMVSGEGVGGKLWPTSFRTNIGFADGTAEVVQDNAHPGLLGIRWARVPTGRNGIDSTSENTWWLDPARDDMPIEANWAMTDPGQTKPNTVTREQFDEFARLPNGQWYPARWHEDRMDRNIRTGKETNSTSYYRLQILPTVKLDDAWFTDPRPRLKEPTSLP